MYSVVGCSGEEGVIVPEIAIVILPSLVNPRIMLKIWQANKTELSKA